MDKLESNMNKQGATSFMEMHKRANGNISRSIDDQNS